MPAFVNEVAKNGFSNWFYDLYSFLIVVWFGASVLNG